MKIKLPEILVNFLKREDIFDDYVNELIHKLKVIETDLDDISAPFYEDVITGEDLSFEIGNYISTLFIWTESIKGQKYWSEMSSKYDEYLGDNNIDKKCSLRDLKR